MKRIISVLLICTLIFSVTGCKKENTDTNTINQSGAVSTDMPDYSDREAIYWASEGRDASDICYHSQSCPLIKDKSPEEISWQMVEVLGMTPCPECNPPKYESKISEEKRNEILGFGDATETPKE